MFVRHWKCFSSSVWSILSKSTRNSPNWYLLHKLSFLSWLEFLPFTLQLSYLLYLSNFQCTGMRLKEKTKYWKNAMVRKITKNKIPKVKHLRRLSLGILITWMIKKPNNQLSHRHWRPTKFSTKTRWKRLKYRNRNKMSLANNNKKAT